MNEYCRPILKFGIKKNYFQILNFFRMMYTRYSYRLYYFLCLCILLLLWTVYTDADEVNSRLSSIDTENEQSLNGYNTNVMEENNKNIENSIPIETRMKKLLDKGLAKEAFEIWSTLSDHYQTYEIQLQLSRALAQLKMNTDAEKLLKSLISSRNKENLSPMDAKILLGKLYVIMDRLSDAQYILNECLYEDKLFKLTNEQYGSIYTSLAKIILRRDNDYKISQSLLIKAWNYNSNEPAVAFELGMILLHGRNFDEAKHWFDTAERLNPSIDHKLLGKVYYHYKRFDWCAKEFIKVVSINPKDAEANLFLAECSEMIGKASAAQKFYETVIDLEPHNALAHTGLGLLLLGTGSRNYGAIHACGSEYAETAVKHLTFALKLDSNMKRARDAIEFCEKEIKEVSMWREIVENLSSYSNMENDVNNPATEKVISKPRSILPIVTPFHILYRIIDKIFQAVGLDIKTTLLSIFDNLPGGSIIQSILFKKSWIKGSTLNSHKYVVSDIEKKWAIRSKSIQAIHRIDDISSEHLLNDYVQKNQPVVITNLLKEWGIKNDSTITSFTTNFFRELFGDKVVRVSVSETGRFDGPEDGKLWGLGSTVDVLVRPPMTSMLMNDFLTLTNRTMKETFYLEYLALHQYLGETFQKYITIPEIISELYLNPLVSNVWIGTKPTASPLHYDDYENFLCQIIGQKEIILFPPADITNLYYVGRPKGMLDYKYPGIFTRNSSNIDKRGFIFGSSVNVDEPNLKIHPKYAFAKPFRVLLSPGDVLYLPAFWHHEVQSLPDKQEGINVAVNFWFENVTSPMEDEKAYY